MGSLDVSLRRAEFLNVIPSAAEFSLFEGSALECHGKGKAAQQRPCCVPGTVLGAWCVFLPRWQAGLPQPLLSCRCDWTFGGVLLFQVISVLGGRFRMSSAIVFLHLQHFLFVDSDGFY